MATDGDRGALADAGQKDGGISSFALKVTAIVAMTLDHVGNIFMDQLPLGATCALFSVGGLVFPVLAYLIVEGYLHTSSVRRYATRLLVFALIAQVPYWIFLEHRGDVLFTLFCGLLVLYLYDHMERKGVFWLVAVGIAFASLFFDWGGAGVILILLFYVLKGKKGEIVLPMLVLIIGLAVPQAIAVIYSGGTEGLPDLFFCAVGFPLAILLIRAYNGKRGRPLKYFFYIYYPAHILAIGLLHMLLV